MILYMTNHTKSLKKHSLKPKHNYSNKTRHTEPDIVVVGKIFAHWCGHCQTLLPEWKKLVHVIKTKQKINSKSNTKYVFIEIEQSQQDAKITRINNTYLKEPHQSKLALQGGFPTLFKITDGKLEYYNGPRTYLEMLNWYTSHTKSHKEVGGELQPPIAKYEGGKSRRNREKRRSSNRKQTRSNTKRGLFSFFQIFQK